MSQPGDMIVVGTHRHYLSVKQQHPDALVLFYVSNIDVYEVYDDDARAVARVFRMTTGDREWGDGGHVPAVRISPHVLDVAIRELTAAGHKVAVCNQRGSVKEYQA